MALSIRMARAGRKSRPFYRIVVADKRMPRDGRYIERLGTYNPLLANDDEQRVVLNAERIKYWLGQGAETSERVAIFLGKAGLAPVPAVPNRPSKSAPSEKTKMRLEEKAEKLKAALEAPAEKQAPVEAPAAEEKPVEDTKAEAPAEATAEKKPAEEEKKEG